VSVWQGCSVELSDIYGAATTACIGIITMQRAGEVFLRAKCSWGVEMVVRWNEGLDIDRVEILQGGWEFMFGIDSNMLRDGVCSCVTSKLQLIFMSFSDIGLCFSSWNEEKDLVMCEWHDSWMMIK